MTEDLRPIRALVQNHRAHRAFDELGILTVADYRRTSRDAMLAVHGVGERTLEEIERAVDPDLAVLEPLAAAVIDDLPLHELDLPVEVAQALMARGVATLHGWLRTTAGAPLDAPQGLAAPDDGALDALRRAIHRATRSGATLPRDDGDVAERILTALEPRTRGLVRQHLGVDDRPRCTTALARRTGLGVTEVHDVLTRAARELAASDDPQFAALRDDAVGELERGEGAIDVRGVTASGVLGRAIRAGRNAELPLRLLAFSHPERFTYDAGRLIGMPRAALETLREEVREVCKRRGLPCGLRRLRRATGEDRVGILRHVVERHLDLAIRFHPERGPRVVQKKASIAARLERILDGLGGPTDVEDLIFHYRDHHGRARGHRILESLRTDTRFVELGPRRFDLRVRHLDELELVRPLAEQLRTRVVATGKRLPIRDPADADAPSERSAWLVIDLLRNDRHVRHLGRGEFCPRHTGGSPIVRSLVEDLRRAMGEVPLSRFLQNQEPRRRRLISRLLRENRRFLSPARDRIDLLENYPFNAERLRLTLREASACLHEHDGYAPVSRVLAAIQAAGLGGVFLTEHLLTDLLRRHGHFEFLPGGILADPEVGLGAWIQSASREAIRRVGRPLSAEQILAHCPELAQFRAGLEAMLELDPLIQAADGMHYQLV